MYNAKVEIYFFEDDKSVTFNFTADTLEEVKNNNINNLINKTGHQYSMMTSEVVVTVTIESNGEYVDSDEYFCTYNSQTGHVKYVA